MAAADKRRRRTVIRGGTSQEGGEGSVSDLATKNRCGWVQQGGLLEDRRGILQRRGDFQEPLSCTRARFRMSAYAIC